MLRTATSARTTSECAKEETSTYAIGEAPVGKLDGDGVQTLSCATNHCAPGASIKSERRRCPKFEFGQHPAVPVIDDVLNMEEIPFEGEAGVALIRAKTCKAEGTNGITRKIQTPDFFMLTRAKAQISFVNQPYRHSGETVPCTGTLLFSERKQDTGSAQRIYATPRIFRRFRGARTVWRRKRHRCRHTSWNFLHASLCAGHLSSVISNDTQELKT